MDPEKAHHLVIDGLTYRKADSRRTCGDARDVWRIGIKSWRWIYSASFPAPYRIWPQVSIRMPKPLIFRDIGFGFAEVGTVTPKDKRATSCPSLFRLPPDEALINRMGFNNDGADAMAEPLAKIKHAAYRLPSISARIS